MKVSKDAARIARQLFKATVADGKVNESVVKTVMEKLTKDKPRGYLGVLSAYSRLVRMELEKYHAVVESAATLNDADQKSVADNLKKKYGDQLTTEFKTNADLIGGMRVRVGSDVWDGSVRARLQNLSNKI